jgi:hypothetical protein
MGSYQRHVKAFLIGAITSAVIAVVLGLILGKRAGYELVGFGFLAGAAAMLVSLSLMWWAGRLGIGKPQIFALLGFVLLAVAGVCAALLSPS